MTFEQLSYFIATYEEGSFAMAAARLFCSASTVSKNVKALEKSLGSALFVPGKSPAIPTEFGHRFFVQARRAVAEYDALASLDPALCDSSVPLVTLAIASQPLRGNLIPSEPLLEFAQHHSNTELRVLYTSNGECSNVLAQGMADVAIALRPSSPGQYRSSRICSYHPLLLVSSSHPFSRQEAVRASQLDGRDIALPVDLGFFYRYVVREFEVAGIKPRFHSVEFTPSKHLSFLEQGGIFFVTPDPAVLEMFPDARVLPLEDEMATIRVDAISLRVPSTPASELLCRFLMEEVSGFSW